MSLCPALPASRMRGAVPPKRDEPSSAAGVSRVRTKPRPPTPRSRASPARAGRTGGKGREQSVDQVVPDPVPDVAEIEPGLPVPGVRRVHQAGGDLPVPVQERPALPGERVPEDGGGVPPPQSVLLEPQLPDRGRGRGQGIERAEGVVHETGMHVLGAADGAADLGLGLQHERPTSHGPRGGWRPPGRWGRHRSRRRRRSRPSLGQVRQAAQCLDVAPPERRIPQQLGHEGRRSALGVLLDHHLGAGAVRPQVEGDPGLAARPGAGPEPEPGARGRRRAPRWCRRAAAARRRRSGAAGRRAAGQWSSTSRIRDAPTTQSG